VVVPKPLETGEKVADQILTLPIYYDLGAFPFFRLEIQLSDLSRYFILYQWMLA